MIRIHLGRFSLLMFIISLLLFISTLVYPNMFISVISIIGCFIFGLLFSIETN